MNKKEEPTGFDADKGFDLSDNSQLAFSYLSMNPLYRSFYNKTKKLLKELGLKRPGEMLGQPPEHYYSDYRKALLDFGLEDFVDPDMCSNELINWLRKRDKKQLTTSGLAEYRGGFDEKYLMRSIWSRHIVHPKISIVPNMPDQSEQFHEWKNSGQWSEDFYNQYVYIKVPRTAIAEDLIDQFTNFLPELGITGRKNKPRLDTHKDQLTTYKVAQKVAHEIGLFQFSKGPKKGFYSLESTNKGGFSKHGWLRSLKHKISEQGYSIQSGSLDEHMKRAQNFVMGDYKSLVSSGKNK